MSACVTSLLQTVPIYPYFFTSIVLQITPFHSELLISVRHFALALTHNYNGLVY